MEGQAGLFISGGLRGRVKPLPVGDLVRASAGSEFPVSKEVIGVNAIALR